MQHVYTLADADPGGPTLVAVGMFDGVHLGHRHLLRRLVETARARDRIPTVLTFFPHPDVVMGRASGRYYLTTPEQRAALLGELGVDLIVTHPFNDEVRQVRAADFVDRLIEHLKLSELWIGPDFALGYKREGNADFLRAQGEAKGFGVEIVDLVTNDDTGHIISSSGIRGALAGGDVEKAARWLGRPYRLTAEVVHGDGRGRTLGFPTANMGVWEEQFLPGNGIYASWAHLGSETFMALTNVGVRPTFDGGHVLVEAYLLDFDRDIYGQTLSLDFVAWLRPEVRFVSVEALVEQIALDVIVGRELLSSLTPPER